MSERKQGIEDAANFLDKNLGNVANIAAGITEAEKILAAMKSGDPARIQQIVTKWKEVNLIYEQAADLDKLAEARINVTADDVLKVVKVALKIGLTVAAMV